MGRMGRIGRKRRGNSSLQYVIILQTHYFTNTNSIKMQESLNYLKIILAIMAKRDQNQVFGTVDWLNIIIIYTGTKEN